MTTFRGTRTNHLAVARAFARTPDDWPTAPRFDPVTRWYTCLAEQPDAQVWLLTWLPGQGTDLHDHGGSAGAFVVVSGALDEETVAPDGDRARVVTRAVTTGAGHAFGAHHIHRLTNTGTVPAVSVHVYGPALESMTRYLLDDGQLRVATRRARRSVLVSAPTRTAPRPPAGARSIDDILADARRRLRRLDPAAAYRAQRSGAVLVDIRPAAQRAHGEIPGALIVERNVLEWRFDPQSDARLPIAGRYDLRIVVFCQEGYTSSLAAAALQEIGLHRATDLAGGIAAWQAAGLPVTIPGLPGADPGAGRPPGTGHTTDGGRR